MFEELITKYNLKVTNYEKNEIIKNEGDVCNSVGIVLEGKIKISNITYFNSEYIIDILKSNDMFGENLIFTNSNKYPGEIIAISKTYILFISKTLFIHLIQKEIDFLVFYLNYISNKYIELQKRIKVLCQSSIRDKLIYYLQINKNNDNVVKISSITDLSHYLNIPRPSLSRVINQLKNEKTILVKKHFITLNYNK